jgi:predicted ATPase
VARARELDHPLSLAYALLLDAMLGQLSCDHSVTGERAGAARAVADEYGIAAFEEWAAVVHGWAIARSGDADEGLKTMRVGLDASAASGSTIMRPYLLGLLGDALASDGQVDEGLRAIDNAVALVETNDERYFEAELYRLRGDLLLRTAQPSPVAAEKAFRRALEVARSQDAKSLELRAAVSAARLLASQKRASEGCTLVSEVYASFTEGLDTRDLLEARRMIEELEG